MLRGKMDDLAFNLQMALKKKIVLNNFYYCWLLKGEKINNLTSLRSKTNYFSLCFAGEIYHSAAISAESRSIMPSANCQQPSGTLIVNMFDHSHLGVAAGTKKAAT